jgi:MFS family permease
VAAAEPPTNRLAGARRDFRWYWAGQSVSVVGDQIAAFVLPTVAITTFGASAFQVGLLNTLGTGSYAVLGLLIGALMDRVRRRPIMLTADVVRALAFGSVPLAARFGSLGLPQLYLVTVVAGVFSVFYNIASQTHLPTLLPNQLLTTANARMEISSTIALVTGPTLGGLLVQWTGGSTALAVNAASFVCSIAGVLLLRTPEPRLAPRTTRSTLGRDIGEGLAELWRHPVLRRTTVSSALRNFGNAAVNTVLLLFAYRALRLSPGEAGVLFASGTVAAVIGAWLATRLTRRLGAGPLLWLANVAGGAWVAAPVALLLPPIPVMLVLRFVASFSLPLWNATVVTVRQRLTPAGVLGRLTATAGTVNFGVMPLGALAAGGVAEAASAAFGTELGLGLTLAVSGVVSAGGAVTLLHREIRALNRARTAQWLAPTEPATPSAA